MKVVIAPDSFKESLTAVEAAEAMQRGVLTACPDATVDLCPMADGGEGTVEALVAATGGARRATTVSGPLGQPVDARWGILGTSRTAVIEMAEAAGLHLVPLARRNPTRTTTFGVGQLIRCALDEGVDGIIVGIGGSATNDGGTGMAQALGVRFAGAAEPMTGGALVEVTSVDLTGRDDRLSRVRIVVACDVTNPLTGPEGAAAIYGPQKGATVEQVRELDAGLAHLASLILGADPEAPGAGAAGGLGFGLVAFCAAELTSGVDLVIEATQLDHRVADADLVLTGEGRLDGQSIRGKTCIGVARAARKHSVPTIALVGSLGPDVQRTLDCGLHSYHALTDRVESRDQSIRHADRLLTDLAAEIVATKVE